MKIALLVITLLALGTTAAAQPVTHPDMGPTLGVEVLAPGGDVDPVAVRAAIASELAIYVTDATAFAPSLGRLEIAVDGEIRIAYHPAAGTVIERTLALPASPDERIEMIAYVATNLVRDQAGEILAGLRPPQIQIPVIAPAPPPRRAPPTLTRHIPATLGFVPPASIDRAFGEHVVVGFGLHALVGMTDGSDFASVSGLADIQHDFAHGAQIGGVAAVSRDVEGVQIGGVGAYTARTMHGVQLGGVAAVSRDVEGVQIGGVAAIARRVEGVQIGGVTSIGGDVHGLQLGVVNVARRMRGVQLGVINISDDGDDAIPIGLINYARNGQLAADAWVDTSQLSAVAFRHGTRHVHNLWGVAWSPDYDHMLVGAGLGAHFALAGKTALDIDALHWLTDVWNDNLGQISQLRASVNLPLGGIELFGGAAANVYVSDEMDESASFHPTYARRTTTSGGTSVVAWPSAFVGVRLRAR